MKQSKSKTAILNAAYDLLCRNSRASLSEIAAHAEVGRATLHRHFAGRDALLNELALRAMDELDAAVDTATQNCETALEALRLAMAAIIPLASRQVFLSQTDVPRALQDRFDATGKETRAAIETAMKDGSLSSGFGSDWIAEVYDALIYVAWDAVERQELTPRQAADHAWRSFISGITGS